MTIRCVPDKHDEDVSTTRQSDDGRRDNRYSRVYKLGETTTLPVTNNDNNNKEVEDCGNGYFLDGKSRRCIGNCDSILQLVIYFAVYVIFKIQATGSFAN